MQRFLPKKKERNVKGSYQKTRQNWFGEVIMNVKGLEQKRATACDYAYTLSDYKNEACACDTRSAYASITSFYCMREQKCADTIGTVLVPWAGHFQC